MTEAMRQKKWAVGLLTLLTDMKYALRSLLKSPGLLVVALTTLALGIGAATGVFSVVNAMLIRPLPFVQPERLAVLYTTFPSMNATAQKFPFSRVEYLALQHQTRAWEKLEAWSTSEVNISTGAEPMSVTTSFVTGGFLSSLGASPAMGRTFAPEDDRPGAPLTAVLSDGFWQRAFGNDRNILGRDILLNGRKCTVIGVMPKAFHFAPGDDDEPEIWTTLQIDPATADNFAHNLVLLGRLNSNVTLRQAQSELDALVGGWKRTGPSGHYFHPKEHAISTYSLAGEMERGLRPALCMLFGAVCFLLLIACVNVTNLLLTRAETRLREIAIRKALGSSIWRVAVRFASEGFLLAGGGAALGLLLAATALRLVDSANVVGVPRGIDFSIDGHVIFFTASLGLSMGVLFTVAPLLRTVRKNPNDVMKSAISAATASATARRFQQTLVVVQLGLTLVLLAGTGLMLKAFWNLSRVPTGIDPRDVVTLSATLPKSTSPGEQSLFWNGLKNRLAELPGAQSMAISTHLPPLFEGARHMATQIEGFTPAKGGPIPYVPIDMDLIPTIDFHQIVTPGYFAALNIRLIAGRVLEERDDDAAPLAVVVNETLARMFWGNARAVGHRLRLLPSRDWYTIVGVVGDVKNDGLDKPAAPQIYMTHQQIPRGTFYSPLASVNVVGRSAGDRLTLASEIRRAMREIDGRLPLGEARTMEQVLNSSRARPEFITRLLTLFASTSLVLAAVGIYGLVAYSVSRQTKEVGIRIALGASRGDVLGLILRRAVTWILCGVSLGLVGAFVTTRLLASYLFDVTATDPATFISVTLLLAGIAVLASYLPARRATKIDPLVALRAE